MVEAAVGRGGGGVTVGQQTKPGDVRAGGAFYEIYAKDGLSGVIDALTAKVQRFGSFMRRAGAGLAGTGGALGAGPLGFLTAGANRAADTAAMADQFRLPIDVMNRLRYAAEQAKVSVGEVMGDTTGRFRELIDKAPGLDPQAARQALATQRDFRDATLALQNAMLPLLGDITPLARGFAAFVRENAAGIAVLGGLAAALVAVGTGMSLLGTGIGIAAAGVKLLVVGFGLLLTPFGLLVSAAAGVGAAWLTMTEAGKAAASALGKAFAAIGSIFGQTWKGIQDAVRAGDLESAFKIAALGIKAVWLSMLIDMGKAFAAFVNDNRDKIIALGGLLGAIQGGRLGRVFGPWGAVIGAGVGGLGGGLGADKLAEILGGMGHAPGMEAALRKALEELAKLAGGAAAAAANVPPMTSPSLSNMFRPFEAVKGAFNIASAGQQFGYGDKAAADERSRQMAAHVAQCARALNQVLPALLTLR